MIENTTVTLYCTVWDFFFLGWKKKRIKFSAENTLTFISLSWKCKGFNLVLRHRFVIFNLEHACVFKSSPLWDGCSWQPWINQQFDNLQAKTTQSVYSYWKRFSSLKLVCHLFLLTNVSPFVHYVVCGRGKIEHAMLWILDRNHPLKVLWFHTCIHLIW